VADGFLEIWTPNPQRIVFRRNQRAIAFNDLIN
jgi:hypothetical protein